MRRRDYIKTIAGITAGMGLAGCIGGGDGDADQDGDGGDGGDSGGDGGGDGGSEPTTIELWHDKGKNPNWNPIFEATTPVLNEVSGESVQVEVVPYQSTDGYQGALRPVLGQKDGPGVFTWWAGQRLRNLAQDGYALDITDVWQEHIDAGRYPESIKKVFSFDGKTYGIPNQVSYWTVWYNKNTFEDLGVQPPTNWDEFRGLTQTIQTESNGETTPVILPLNPGWTGFIWFEEMVARQDLEFYNRLCAGEAKYTDETAVEALRMMGQLQKDGVFGEASTSFSLGLSEIPKGLENGDYAMTLIGSWVSGVFSGADVDFSKYGWFELPSINSDVGNQLIIEPGPFVMHKGGADQEALRTVADGLLSTEFRQTWMEELGNIPVNTEVDSSYLGDNMSRLAEETASGKYGFPLRYWENTSPEVAVPASKQMKKIFQNPDQAEQIAQDLDDIRADVYD